ncbi:MAG: hypothetical protein OEU54_06940 [Gemmatimonadota bacterium]|nr:hypothetical protein [Gemmatimonadota bacterium]
MSPAVRSVALVALGAGVALGASTLIRGQRPDERSEILQQLADRGAARIDEMGGAGGDETNDAMALSRFYRLNEFRRLGEEGQALVWVVPVPPGREDDPIEAASGGAVLRLPRVAVDPAARDTWSREAARLAGLEGNVDARVFAAFAAIRAYVSEHPWPTGVGLVAVRGSEWASADVTETWLSLNRALVSRVDALLEGL